MLFDLNQTMQYSTSESWIPCDTEVQLLCPSKPSPWSKVRRACTQWLPKNLESRSTPVRCFSSCPLAGLAVYESGSWVFWLRMMWSPSASHPVVPWCCQLELVPWPHQCGFTRWGHFTPFAPPCPRACQVFGVCCAPWLGVVLFSVCQSIVDLVLTVKNPCDVSNPVQVRFHFCCFCVSLIFLLPWQFRDKCPCGQDCW